MTIRRSVQTGRDQLIGISGTGNRLLDALPSEDRQWIVDRATLTDMPLGTIALERGEEIPYVHFPTRGVLSLITATREGSTIEVSTIGNEGATGVPAFVGSRQEGNVRCSSPGGGQSLRVGIE